MRVLKAPNELLTPQQIWESSQRSGLVSSRKYDGNRGICIAGQLLSSSMKEPRNSGLHTWLEPLKAYCEKESLVLDFEIFSPSQEHHAETSGVINSFDMDLPDDIVCMVFDGAPVSLWEDECVEKPYRERIPVYEKAVKDIGMSNVLPVAQRIVSSEDELVTLFGSDLQEGLEGSMVRCLDIWYEGSRIRGGFYKHGRATTSQCVIWKQKQYLTLDGVIIGVQQRRMLRPDWPRTRDSNGLLVRPLEKEAYVYTESVGALVVAVRKDDDTWYLTEIGFGKGFDLPYRELLWAMYRGDPASLYGRWVEFLHMPHGAKSEGKARAGRLKRFRDDLERVSPEQLQTLMGLNDAHVDDSVRAVV